MGLELLESIDLLLFILIQNMFVVKKLANVSLYILKQTLVKSLFPSKLVIFVVNNN